MNELDLILMIVSFGFTGTFAILWYMIKTFIHHKEKSDEWKMIHSNDLSALKQEVKDIKRKEN